MVCNSSVIDVFAKNQTSKNVFCLQINVSRNRAINYIVRLDFNVIDRLLSHYALLNNDIIILNDNGQALSLVPT